MDADVGNRRAGPVDAAARVSEDTEFVAVAGAMLELREALERAAATDVRVVVYGEPGAGKSTVARQLHRLSERREAAFARVSVRDEQCVERLSRPGFLPSLAGGTLVLEGIDEASSEAQAFLVGLVEEWGGHEEVEESPVRVVATGLTDLLEQVSRGAFRKDLYYLLDVFPLHLRPLRERCEEIPAYLELFGRRHGTFTPLPPVPHEFLAEALEYTWPGNLRELENTVRAALPARPGQPWRFPRMLPRAAGDDRVEFQRAKRDFERGYVHRLLTLTGGNVTRAATLAGKARKDFYALMARNRIEPDAFRSGGVQ